MMPDEVKNLKLAALTDRDIRRRINTLEHCLRVAMDALPPSSPLSVLALANIRELLFRAGIDLGRL